MSDPTISGDRRIAHCPSLFLGGIDAPFPVTKIIVPACRKCHDEGWYAYDENHGKPCEECCTHPGGWFLLTEGHGASDERYAACKSPGCGTTITKSEYEALA